MTENLETIFFLLLASVLMVGVAQKIRVPYPLVLILGGAGISFIPGIGNIYFNPNFVLMIFLPPILYYAAFGISFREFQKNWKNIFSLALGLVVATTVVVGILFKWLFPQFPWPLAFAFGAIVSPPDAVAVTSILKRFSMNSRLITLLEGESLINDASAIVIYKISVIALLKGSLSLEEGAWTFFHVAVGGLAVGAILGIIFQLFSKKYLEPVLGVLFSFTIPYVTYAVADLLDVSGVLAVVLCGLIGARMLHTHHSSLRRVLGYAVWDILIIFLNCLVFILIGLQVRTITHEMSYNQILIYSGYSLLIVFAMVILRLLWVYGREVIHYRSAPNPSHSLKEATIIGWAGMRGIVSLAVALSLPFTLPTGVFLEGRDEVIFMTFVVILITLLVPGLTLPALIHWLKVHSLVTHDHEKQTRQKLAQHTDELIISFFELKKINQKEYRFLRNYFRSQHQVLALSHGLENESSLESARKEIIKSQRSKLLEIWKQHEIDDQLFNHLENELDMLETHIARAKL